MSAYTDAGGDAAQLALLSSVGDMHAIGDNNSRCVAGIHPDNPTVGAVGDWVGDIDVLHQAEAWLRAKGCTVARGPMLLCSWFSYRVNNGPHDHGPFLLEPTEAPERWHAAGYSPCAEYASTLMPHDAILKASIPIAARLESEGWSIESLPKDSEGRIPAHAFVDAVDIIHDIAHEAFADAFGFVPLPRAALQAMYAPYRLALDPDLILFARDPAGRPAGFIFGVPDLADVNRRWAIIKTSAIRPSYAGMRLGTWLNATAHQRFRRKGYQSAVYALMWSGSPSQSWSRFGGEPLRTYSLLERSLSPA